MSKANLNTIIVNFFQKKQFWGAAHLNTILVNIYLLIITSNSIFDKTFCKK